MSLLINKKVEFNAGKVDRIVSSKYNLNTEIIRSRLRDNETARARFVAWYILRNKFLMKYTIIGKLYGRDHTTIINGIRRLKKLGLENEAKEIIKSELSR